MLPITFGYSIKKKIEMKRFFFNIVFNTSLIPFFSSVDLTYRERFNKGYI